MYLDKLIDTYKWCKNLDPKGATTLLLPTFCGVDPTTIVHFADAFNLAEFRYLAQESYSDYAGVSIKRLTAALKDMKTGTYDFSPHIYAEKGKAAYINLNHVLVTVEDKAALKMSFHFVNWDKLGQHPAPGSWQEAFLKTVKDFAYKHNGHIVAANLWKTYAPSDVKLPAFLTNLRGNPNQVEQLQKKSIAAKVRAVNRNAKAPSPRQ